MTARLKSFPAAGLQTFLKKIAISFVGLIENVIVYYQSIILFSLFPEEVMPNSVFIVICFWHVQRGGATQVFVVNES